jgi:septum formation inhibitor-activating ATPase MinD
MKIKKMLKVIIICIGILFIMSCQNNKKIHIFVVNEMQKELLKNFILIKDYDIEIFDNNNYLTLDKINEKILIDIIGILYLKIDILKDNIVNSNTTRTVEGGPFLRSYLKVTAENGI